MDIKDMINTTCESRSNYEFTNYEPGIVHGTRGTVVFQVPICAIIIIMYKIITVTTLIPQEDTPTHMYSKFITQRTPSTLSFTLCILHILICKSHPYIATSHNHHRNVYKTCCSYSWYSSWITYVDSQLTLLSLSYWNISGTTTTMTKCFFASMGLLHGTLYGHCG